MFKNLLDWLLFDKETLSEAKRLKAQEELTGIKIEVEEVRGLIGSKLIGKHTIVDENKYKNFMKGLLHRGNHDT